MKIIDFLIFIKNSKSHDVIILSYGGILLSEFRELFFTINIRILGLVVSRPFGMVDRWAWLAHASQVYCFSPVGGVSSLFKIIIGGYSYIVLLVYTFSRFFTHEQADAALMHRDR